MHFLPFAGGQAEDAQDGSVQHFTVCLRRTQADEPYDERCFTVRSGWKNNLK